jgi:hypothetical protein
MSVEIEEMVRRYAEHEERLALPVTAAEARTRAERRAAGDGAVGAATGSDGSGSERGYFIDQHEHHTVALPGPRSRKRRLLVALTVAALIATVVVVVTRSRTSDQPGISPTPPSSPATTVSPATTALPAGMGPLSPATTPCFPAITPDVFADGQVVHIIATGCIPSVTYLISECGVPDTLIPVPDPLGDCLKQFVIADGTGTISTYFKVQKVFPWVDCSVAPEGLGSGCGISLNRPYGNALNRQPHSGWIGTGVGITVDQRGDLHVTGGGEGQYNY